MKNKRALAVTIASLIALISLSCSAARRAVQASGQKTFAYKSMPKFQRKMPKEEQITRLEERIVTWKEQIGRHEGSIKHLKNRIKETETKIKELKRRK